MKLKFSICLFLWGLVSSCDEKSNSKKNIFEFSKSDSLRMSKDFVLDEVYKANYYLTIINNGESKTIQSSTLLNVKINIQYDTSQRQIIQVMFNKLEMSTNNNQELMEYSSDNMDNNFNSIGHLLGLIKGTKIIYSIDKNGKIIKEEGQDELQAKIHAMVTGLDKAQSEQLNEFVAQLVGGEFYKNNVSPVIHYFPDSLIYEGYKWNRQNDVPALMSFRTDANYEVAEISDHKAEVSIHGKIISKKDKEVNLLGNQASFDLDGTIKGEAMIDLNTGILSSSEEEIKTEGTMYIANQSVPVKGKLRKVIKITVE